MYDRADSGYSRCHVVCTAGAAHGPLSLGTWGQTTAQTRCPLAQASGDEDAQRQPTLPGRDHVRGCPGHGDSPARLSGGPHNNKGMDNPGDDLAPCLELLIGDWLASGFQEGQPVLIDNPAGCQELVEFSLCLGRA